MTLILTPNIQNLGKRTNCFPKFTDRRHSPPPSCVQFNHSINSIHGFLISVSLESRRDQKAGVASNYFHVPRFLRTSISLNCQCWAHIKSHGPLKSDVSRKAPTANKSSKHLIVFGSFPDGRFSSPPSGTGCGRHRHREIRGR